MPEISITPIYTAITILIMVLLAARAAVSRNKFRTALGDGGNDEMAVILRGFGNLAEYAPAVLLLLLMMEIKGVETKWLHIYGSVFIALRILHPIALFGKTNVTKFKRIGRSVSAGGTLILMVIGAITLLM
jgi:uncharacterized membrane protein YecN with MAPEG domain